MEDFAEKVRVSSDDQSMWQSGDALTYDWVEYVPIIGGDITQYTIESAEISSGNGKVTINDGRIEYDSEGAYDSLQRDALATLTITYVVSNDSGVRETKTAEIAVTGAGGGNTPDFLHVDSGAEGEGAVTFSAVTAAEMLQDAHQFEQLVPVDIDFDAAESLAGAIQTASAALQAEVDRNQANLDEAEDELAALEADRDAAALKEVYILAYTGKSAELALDYAAYEAASAARDGFNTIFSAYQSADVEKELAEAAKAAAVAAYWSASAGVTAANKGLDGANFALEGAGGAVDLARNAVTGQNGVIATAETVLNGAKDVLADLVSLVDDIGDWLSGAAGSIGYFAHLAALESSKAAAYLYAWLDDDDYNYWSWRVTQLKNQKAAEATAIGDKATQESKVEELAETLRVEKISLAALEGAFDDAFDAATDAVADAKEDVADAKVVLQNKLDDYYVEQARTVAAIDDLAAKLEELTDAGGEYAGDALQGVVDDSVDAYNETYYARIDALDALQAEGHFLNDTPDLVDLADATAELVAKQALVTAKDIEIFGTEGYAAILDVSQTAFNTLTDSNLTAEIEVRVDSYMQAGLLIDFALDGGSVDTDIDFLLTSNAAYDVVSNTFTIAPTITNDTTGESVAFETVSPNITFFAGLAYSAGATFEFLTDIYAKFAGIELLDFPNGSDPATFTETVQIDGIVPLIDFNSADFGFSFAPPGFLGDIISFDFNSPSIETEGTAAEFDADFYKDVTGTSLDEIANVILDLIDLRLEFSDEFKQVLIDNGSATELGFNAELGETIVNALVAVLDTLGGDYDEDGDGYVPILVVEQRSDGSLLHINSIADDLEGLDDPDKAEFGFFIAQGSSDNIFQVNLDVDQLIATVINVALGNTPESTLNPLDLSLNLFDLFESGTETNDKDKEDDADKEDDSVTEETKTGIDKIKEYFNLEFGFELADLDVRAGAGFRQDFALSIDDIDYQVTFEDGTVGDFSANDEGEIVFEDASDLVDTNGNGVIDYTLGFTPSAEFFNDTEVALNVGYTLDLLKASFDFTAGLPFLDVGYDLSVALGPLLRLDGEVDILSMDIFEDRFAFNAGSGEVTGSFVTNVAPVAADKTIKANEDTARTISVLNNDSDEDGDSLHVSDVSDGAHGTVAINKAGTKVIYTPDADFDGVDQFTYTVSDGHGGTDQAQVYMTVAAINDAPVARNDKGGAFTTDENQTLEVGNLLSNDSDVDGDTLTIVSADTSGLSGKIIQNADSSFTYDPNGAFDALLDGETATDSMQYTVSDGNDGTSSATVTFTVQGVGAASSDGVTGTLGDDVLNGTTGTDQFKGLVGDDTFAFNADGDRATENVGEGFDTIRATANVTLGGAEIEEVVLDGSGNHQATGNKFATEIIGNGGNNILVGGGGGDVITGNGGADFFAFLTNDASGAATISDFGGRDKIAIDDRFFGIGDGSIDVRAVSVALLVNAVSNGLAGFERSTGSLWVDQDGTRGSGDRDVIAVLEGVASIGADDLLLF